MNITNKSLRVVHIGNTQINPGDTKPLPKDVVANERLMRHVMKDAEAGTIEIGEPADSKKPDQKAPKPEQK